MIIYFANRRMDILGLAVTVLPSGFVVTEDLKIEDVETGVASFECKIGFTKENRSVAESMTEAGNYLLRSNDDENEFYTIIDSEIDTREQTVYIYAEDAGLDLLNEIAGEFTATEAHTAEWYVNKYISDSGFEIGINEVPESSTRTLTWEGESTCTERIASIATQFGGFEVSYSFDVQGMQVTHKYVNIYEKRGKDIAEQLRLNQEIDRIIIKKSVANLATALYCTGGTLDDQDKPIDLTGYEYDDGDFYVDGNKLKSRNALEKWSRYRWEKKQAGSDGHIVRTFSYDTTSQQTLCAHAITELKKICDVEINHELEIKELPENIKIGDRINIVDDAGGLYLSSRLLKLEVSIADHYKTATLGEHLIKNGGISQKVQDLADQFEETHKKVEDATQKVNSAEKDLESAQQAAKDAQEAADDAQAKAEEAASAAANAKAEAANAAAQVQIAESKAEEAIQKAETAQGTADEASVQAADAKSTADAAKLDAAAAEKEIATLGDRLTTVTRTMEADYARKTDLTEATASLQTQISQNAAELSSTATKVQKIDETANNAAAQAAQAQTTAATAQEQADQAAADAEAAQTAAANAAASAVNAQTEADTAKAAAADAQSAADTAKAKAEKAQDDLEAAKANLTEVSSKVDATEAEVAAAQKAVVDAQTAADQAAADAAAAQTAADSAKTDAAKAQTVADNAKKAADTAKAAADQAQADADAAQEAVDALAVRVTEAETKITQNAEKIELAATRTEVADMLGGYSTKQETESAIQVKADEITSRVSSTYATQEAVEAAQSTATQTAEKMEWIVESGTSAADFTLTDRTAALVADYINLKGLVSFSGLDNDAQAKINNISTIANESKTQIAEWCHANDTTLIDGSKIYTGSISADKISADSLEALSAKLAGWTVTDAKIYAGDSITGTAVMQRPTDQTTFVFAAGGASHESYSDCPFRVTKAGRLYAKDMVCESSIYLYDATNEKTLKFVAADGGAGFLTPCYFGSTVDFQKAVTATTIETSGNIYTMNLKLGSFGSLDTATIYTTWADANSHNIIERGAQGLNTYLGWIGSNSYKTITALRGQTVRCINSAGTTNLSDVRLKKDFESLERWEGFYNSIEPCAFKYTNGSSGRNHIGFKAQQIEAALEANHLTTKDFAGFVRYDVEPDTDGWNGYETEYGLIYTEFVALNTYMIQKLAKRVAELERQI